MEKPTKHIAFFTQSGQEISLIADKLGKWPDLIVTNRADLTGVDEDLLRARGDQIVFLPDRPKPVDYLNIADEIGYSILNERWQKDVIVTLHGYLRIIPAEFCDTSVVYNGHPGLITMYPELKGYNPQQRAFDTGYDFYGTVIHRVTPDLDDGPVVDSAVTEHRPGKFECVEDLIGYLKCMSVDLWCSFLENYTDKYTIES